MQLLLQSHMLEEGNKVLFSRLDSFEVVADGEGFEILPDLDVLLPAGVLYLLKNLAVCVDLLLLHYHNLFRGFQKRQKVEGILHFVPLRRFCDVLFVPRAVLPSAREMREIVKNDVTA